MKLSTFSFWTSSLSSLALVLSFPSLRDQIPNGMRVPCMEEVGGCAPAEREDQPTMVCPGVGHQTCEGGSMPLNAFGEDFRSNGFRWTVELCRMDSDGDGRTNGEELGDPCCTWDPFASIGVESWPKERITHPGIKESFVESEDRSERNCAMELELDNEKERQVNGAMDGYRMPATVDTVFLEGEPRRHKDFRVNNHLVPASSKDTYFDFGFNFKDDDCSGIECQIVGIQVILDNQEMVHHYVLTACPEAYPYPLGNGSAVTPNERCTERLAAWIPGRDFFMVAPPESGYSFGGDTGNSIEGFQLQIHYHNEEQKLHQFDSSGFRLFYTTQARDMRLGSFFGTKVEWDMLNTIPPGKKRFFVTEGCTVTGLQERALLVYSIYHAHMLAREMFSTLYRADGEKIPIYEDLNWNFNDQYSARVKEKNITIFNGDVIQSTCVYDSTGVSTHTAFGPRTQDEMCHGIYWIEPFPLGMKCASLGYWEGELAAGEDGHTIRENHPSTQGFAVSGIQTMKKCDPELLHHLLESPEEFNMLLEHCQHTSGSDMDKRECAMEILELMACTVEGKPMSEFLSVEYKGKTMKALQRLVTFAESASMHSHLS